MARNPDSGEVQDILELSVAVTLCAGAFSDDAKAETAADFSFKSRSQRALIAAVI